MSKPKRQYTYLITKRSRDMFNYIGEDTTYHVKVKADTIEAAEKKARDAGEVRTGYNPDRYNYKIELLEVEEI